MNKMYIDSVGEVNLSQVAAELGWKFFTKGKENQDESVTSTAHLALKLCETLQAAKAVVEGGNPEDIPATEAIPRTTRKMLIAEQGRRNPNTSKYGAIANYACKYKQNVQAIAFGTQKPDDEELKQLGEHFSSLSLVLAQVDL